MSPRRLLIAAVAVFVAFGAAYGLAKGGGDSHPAAAGKPAEVLDPGAAKLKAGVPAGGRMPSLRVPKASTSSDGGGAPSGGDALPPATTTPQPPAATPTATAPPSTGGSATPEPP